MTSPYHTPALADEVVRVLEPRPGRVFVDGTVGGGGHAFLLGQQLQPGGTLVVIDRDREALTAARSRLQPLSVTVVEAHGNFRSMRSLLSAHDIVAVDGVVLDLGVSSHQLDAGERGFSFRTDAPLDMRMDPTSGLSAADLLARLDERQLSNVLRDYGEERWHSRIARFIVERRRQRPLQTTNELAELVSAAIPKAAQPRDIHPATRVFQALRIAVNDEIGALSEGIDEAVAILKPGGRLAVISYHSLEDRVVKQAFARLTGKCQCPPGLPICRCGAKQVTKTLTRKPVMPSEEETRRNPRARSAKLRAAEKL